KDPAVARLAGRAVTRTEGHLNHRWFLMTRGAVDYRNGRYAEAAGWMRRCLSARAEPAEWTPDGVISWVSQMVLPGLREPYCDALAELFLAMTHAQMKEGGKAREALARARAHRDKLPTPGPAPHWPAWVSVEAIFREAEATVGR
ncbi:MAG: hypothetical protein ACRC33_28610, partial [Gemmataceae bacterium]